MECPNAAMNEGCSVKCRFDFDFSSEFGYFSHSDFANFGNSSPGFGIFDSIFLDGMVSLHITRQALRFSILLRFM